MGTSNFNGTKKAHRYLCAYKLLFLKVLFHFLKINIVTVNFICTLLAGRLRCVLRPLHIFHLLLHLCHFTLRCTGYCHYW